MTSLALDAEPAGSRTTVGATSSKDAASDPGGRTRFAFLAETSRWLGDSLETAWQKSGRAQQWVRAAFAR